MIGKQPKNNEIKIKAEFRDQIHNAIPTQYMRSAGVSPYFIPIFGNWYWKRLQIVLELSKLYASKKELNIGDFGCGFGIFVSLLSIEFNSKIIGVDTYPLEVLKVAKDLCDKFSGNNNYSFIRADIENLPFRSETFDLCFCLDVLEHVPNVATSLGEIKRVLNEDGILIVSVPVESQILKIIREIYTLKGRLGDNNPH